MDLVSLGLIFLRTSSKHQEKQCGSNLNIKSGWNVEDTDAFWKPLKVPWMANEGRSS